MAKLKVIKILKVGKAKVFFTFFKNNFYVQYDTLNELHRIKLEYVNGF